ncbi:heme exporter protein C [Flexibacter flexilis DSM 6793]|uniref:Heme exporter protein C n=2 Tax=Flexibacter flexilis TaxID=998 RepID=A0A1I1JAJ7_9BACT|nr:heme exporter protein C [Flexibacter flexilis DSM 6793]
MMKQHWWKALAIVLLLYTVTMGFLGNVPHLPILNETIRNLYFHVAMWFAMMILLTVSVVYSVKYLRSNILDHDTVAVEMANMGILCGVLGLTTGSVWARFTWGDWWTNDPKLNAAAIGMLIYLAYLVLRNSLEDEQQRARIAAVYNIFAFAVFIPLIFILPRLTDSLHPGNGGNPGFNSYDLDSQLRKVFYPAVLGWTLLGVWIASLRIRVRRLEQKLKS